MTNYLQRITATDLENYSTLLKCEINSKNELKNFINNWSIIESFISDKINQIHLDLASNTIDPVICREYENFIEKSFPEIKEIDYKLKLKIVTNKFIGELVLEDTNYEYGLKCLESDIKTTNHSNSDLENLIKKYEQRYSEIVSQISIDHNHTQYPLYSAISLLQSTNKELRREIFTKISIERLKHKDEFNEIYSNLIRTRNLTAKNSGFKNYVEYIFEVKHRYTYNMKDCKLFNDNIRRSIIPTLLSYDEMRLDALRIDKLKPWDMAINPYKLDTGSFFLNENDFINKALLVIKNIDEEFHKTIKVSHDNNQLDIFPRVNKAPGAFHVGFLGKGASFIFGNFNINLQGFISLMHEIGHSIHFSLYKDLKINLFTRQQDEIGEFAALAFELISMQHWALFITDKDELLQTQKYFLLSILQRLLWTSTLDEFQYWAYSNPDHSIEERNSTWLSIFEKFSTQSIDWSDMNEFKEIFWQKEVHIFEMPFYSIEYNIAQLAAISIWRKYIEEPAEALEQYKKILKLGSKKDFIEAYKSINIDFSFYDDTEKNLDFLINYLGTI